jgi:hypothetical protein
MRLNRPGILPAGGRLNAKVMSTDAHRVAEAGGIFSAIGPSYLNRSTASTLHCLV